MLQPKLSIVIPVYNSEAYLAECLDSILAQDFKDYEVLCVDDASTDRSREILEEYAGKDGRIHVLTQAHGGPGIARNRGMGKSVGEYLFFMDSDDLLSRKDALARMVGAMDADGLDLLCFQAEVIFENEYI